MTSVMIIGAGPVGLSLAIDLARYGVPVRIVDRSAAPTDQSRALVVWSRTLELLDRFGLASEFLAKGLRTTGAAVFAGTKRLARVSFEGLPTPYPFGLMIPQRDTERCLEAYLRGLGVCVERQVECLGIEPETAHVTATLRRPDGRIETAVTPWLVGCDGAHSGVRHRMGLSFEGSTDHNAWVLADVRLSGPALTGDVQVCWHADGVLALFPLSSERYRVIADVGSKETSDPTLADIHNLLDRRGPGGLAASDPAWLGSFRISERKVSRYRVGRVFLAGDAAHIHSPAGGQGMNTGMQDAFNLAWKLASVERGGSPRLLDTYSLERSVVGDEILRARGLMTRVAVLRGSFRQRLRNGLFPLLLSSGFAQRLVARRLTELTIRYRNSPLSVGASPYPPARGERAPVRAGEPPVGSGGSPRFVLFASPGQDIDAFLTRHSAWVDPLCRPPFHPNGLWLVRPDGYVAVSTSRADLSSVERSLQTLTAGP